MSMIDYTEDPFTEDLLDWCEGEPDLYEEEGEEQFWREQSDAQFEDELANFLDQE